MECGHIFHLQNGGGLSGAHLASSMGVCFAYSWDRRVTSAIAMTFCSGRVLYNMQSHESESHLCGVCLSLLILLPDFEITRIYKVIGIPDRCFKWNYEGLGIL